MAFWVGETVYLNSGSPPMTIVGLTSVGEIVVDWLGPNGERERSSFPLACLMPAPPADDEDK